MHDTTAARTSARRYGPRGWLAALALLSMAACDLGVTNPGAIDDNDLNTPEGVIAMANGAAGAFGYATTAPGGGGLYLASALLTDELTHVGTWQPLREISEGAPGNSSPENQAHWGSASEARWMAEDVAARISRLVGDAEKNPAVAMVTLYAGFANRVMGDVFCQAVINGGPLQENTAFHQRAIEYFDRAIAVATAAGDANLATAAYGGRAQARAMLGDWAGVVADAGKVATAYRYLQIHSENSEYEYNGVHRWATGYQGQQVSVWGTPFAQWGTEIKGALASEGDPRVRFEVRTTAAGDPARGGDGRRPLWYAHKYASLGAGIPIVKGTEMRLLEAEAALVGGNWEQAVSKVNEVRAFHGLAAAAATDAESAWTLLMKERGVELWLEGRRLADLRRWAKTPGSVPFQVVRGAAIGQPASQDPWKNVLDVEHLCLRVGTDELNANPKL